eukprot:8424700-Pyramimonas_sp.AAC.1
MERAIERERESDRENDTDNNDNEREREKDSGKAWSTCGCFITSFDMGFIWCKYRFARSSYELCPSFAHAIIMLCALS